MLFCDFLTRLKHNNKFPHSLIINNTNCCDLNELAKIYLKSLVCNKNLFCDVCSNCTRINNGSYIDFIYLSNDDEIIIKDDINKIQTAFNNVSTESSGIKLYVIKNIETANKHVVNSLLKFLEEPPTNTFALFFTRNVYSVLPTIRSRSQIIKISDKSTIDSNNKIYEKIFSDYDEYKKFIQNYDLDVIFNVAQQFVNCASEFDQLEIIKSIKIFSKYELVVFFDILIEIVPIEKKLNFIELKKGIKLNINKNSLIVKMFDEMK